MARALTDNERAVLEHVVVDANAWWQHANDIEKIDEEAALAEKVDKWQPSYGIAKEGVAYAPRADRANEARAAFVKARVEALES